MANKYVRIVSKLPTKKGYGININKRDCIDYASMVGLDIFFEYKNVICELPIKILRYNKEEFKFEIEFNGKKIDIDCYQFSSNSFYRTIFPLMKIGERKIMNCGLEAEIIDCNSLRNIIVKFPSTGETISNIQYSNFKKGTVKSHFTPSVYGTGVTGVGDTRDVNGKTLKSYKCWLGVLERSYDEVFKEKYTTYKETTCCKEWLFYPNFKKWYDENYYEIHELGRTEIDKDILVKGNKVYSPETCIFVPHRINTLFLGDYTNKKDNNIPVGITMRKDKYSVSCHNGEKQIYLGKFSELPKAIECYINFKLKLIDDIILKYSKKIPNKVIIAMKNHYLNGGKNE